MNLTHAEHRFLDQLEQQHRDRRERDRRDRADAAARTFDVATAILDRAQNPNGPRRAEMLEEYSSAIGQLRQGAGISTGPTELFLPESFFTAAAPSRTLNSSDSLYGAGLLNTNPAESFVDLLRIDSPLGKLGVRYESALGTVGRTQALLESGAEASWCAEGVAPDESLPAVGGTDLVAREAVLWITVTRELLAVGGARVERWLARMMFDAVSRAAARAVFAGTGADNQPLGVLYNDDVPLVVGGTNGAAINRAHLAEMRLSVGQSGVDTSNCAWVTSPLVGRKLMNTADDGGRLFDPDRGRGRLLGHPVTETAHIPDDLDKGDSVGVCSSVLFGNWRDVTVTTWGSPSLIVDPYTLATTGKIRMTCWISMDVHVARPTSFARMNDALTA